MIKVASYDFFKMIFPMKLHLELPPVHFLFFLPGHFGQSHVLHGEAGGVHGGDYNGSPLPESVRADAAFPMSTYPVEPSPSEGLVDRLLPAVGASRPERDAVDARIVEDVVAGTGGLIDHPDEVGGWPTLAPGEPPADADRDGLPDDWESERGLDPDDASDAWADRDGDGWSNLEEFLACS